MNAEIELYAQGNSILHRWEAKWKLLALLVMMLSFAQLNQIWWAFTGLLTGYALLFLLQLPSKIILKRVTQIHVIFIPCFIILPFTADGNLQNISGIQFSMEGLQLALLFYIRAVSVILLSLVLIYSTPMTRLFHAAEQLWIPKVIVQITLLTYRYLFSLSWEFNNVRNALRSRGFVNSMSLNVYRTYANVIGTSLIRSLERTNRVYHAMQCRGYQGHVCLQEEPAVTLSDILFFIIGCIFAISLIWLDWNYGST